MVEPIDTAAIEQLRIMCGDDADTMLPELINAFRDDTVGLVASLHTSLASGDKEIMRAAAHSLISSSLSFGAVRLSELARDLETLVKQGTLDGAATHISRIDEEFSRVQEALSALP